MNLEDRIKRRILTESTWLEDGYGCLVEYANGGDGTDPVNLGGPVHASVQDAARIAALEVEDSANPIAQTEQVRPPLRLNIDIAAFQAVYDDLDHH